MPRQLWKGAIQFGLVHVPVSLYPAEQRDELSFSLLDRRDMQPVGYQRVNKSTGEEVPFEDVVKGYEYEKGEYVTLEKEDFKRANVEATQTVDIVGFVDADAIPPYYFDAPYYLAPEKHGAKGYALLRETLEKTGRVGIANVVIRTRQHVAALYPQDNVLVLNTLRYHDELRDPKDLDVPESSKAAKVQPREIDMAERLVEDMATEWKPAQFKDTYREDLMKFIEAKAAGKVKAAPKGKRAPRQAEIIDFAKLLEKSPAAVKKGDAPASGKRTAASRRKRKAPAAAKGAHHHRRAA
jgi:DNA end-binding protein Ku